MSVPGSDTVQICTRCGKTNLMASRFCEQCGHALANLGPILTPPKLNVPPPAPPAPPVEPTPTSPGIKPAPRAKGAGGATRRPSSQPARSGDTVPLPPLPDPDAPSAPPGDTYDPASIVMGPYPASYDAGTAYPSEPPLPAAPPPPQVLPPRTQPSPVPGAPPAPITAAGFGRAPAPPPPDVGALPPWVGPSPTVRPESWAGQWSQGDLIDGRYRVHRKVVSGMGIVYLCYDQQAREPVAIKTYLDSVLGTARHISGQESELAQQFESEALLWIRLGRHPHVVQARYVLRLGGKPHIFLEYVPAPAGGESTVRRLLRAGPVDVATALLLAIQTCAGLEHATSVFPGFVHRDLKPENLLLTPDHVLKVTDFGLTKVFADFSGEVGVIAGTPPYMSPEQCLGLPALDTRSDVYALGVILYELLTGRRPFLAADVEGHLRAHLIDAPMPPRELVRAIPEAVEHLVLRCLEKSPEARFPDFVALRAALTECYQTVTGHPPSLPEPVDEDEGASAGLASIELARAISLVTLGRYDEAMLFFDLAVEHDPALARAWYFRGLALNGLGRFAEALECLDQVVALDPKDPNAWVEKGRALTRSGRREAALECFDRAIAINPWELAALYEKGICLLFLRRFAEAEACIGEVAAVQPGPAVEAAREACRAGLRQASGVEGAADPSRTYVEPLDELDLRT